MKIWYLIQYLIDVFPYLYNIWNFSRERYSSMADAHLSVYIKTSERKASVT